MMMVGAASAWHSQHLYHELIHHFEVLKTGNPTIPFLAWKSVHIVKMISQHGEVKENKKLLFPWQSEILLQTPAQRQYAE